MFQGDAVVEEQRSGAASWRQRILESGVLQPNRETCSEALQVQGQLRLHYQVQCAHLPPQGFVRAVPTRCQSLLPLGCCSGSHSRLALLRCQSHRPSRLRGRRQYV